MSPDEARGPPGIRPPVRPGPPAGASPGRPSAPASWARRLVTFSLAALLVAAVVAAVTLPREVRRETPLPANAERVASLAVDDPGRAVPYAMALLGNETLAVSLPGRPTAYDDRVLLVDLARWEVSGHLATDPGPASLLVHPSDPSLLLVGHLWSSGVEVWDWADRERLAEIPAPHYVTDLAASPDGAWLYAVSLESGALHVVDLALEERSVDLGAGGRSTARVPSGTEVATVPVSPGGRCLAVSPANRVAVCGALGGRLDLLDPGSRPSDAALAANRTVLELGVPTLSAAFAGEDLWVGTSERPDDGAAPLGWGAAESGLLRVPGNGSGLERWWADTTGASVEAERRVVAGALPVDLRLEGGALWVTYEGTDQVQRLVLEGGIPVPTGPPLGGFGRMSHVEAGVALSHGNLSDTVHGLHETGAGPIASLSTRGFLLSLDARAATLTVTDISDCAGPSEPLAGCTRFTLALDDAPPFPSGAAEEGRALFGSALWSASQDAACASCHLLGGDTDGLVHRLPLVPGGEARSEGTAGLLHLAPTAPYLSDGTLLRLREYPGIAAMVRSFGANGTGAAADPDPSVLAGLGLPAAWGLREVGDALAAALVAENGLPPNPHAKPSGDDARLAAEGRAIFLGEAAACSSCHVLPHASGPPSDRVLEGTSGDRDVPSLRGVWRLGSALPALSGDPASPRELLLPARHSCLATGERGLAAASGHGGAAGLTCDGIEALLAFLRTL